MTGYAIKGRLIDGVGDTAIEKGLVAVLGEDIVYAGDAAGYGIPPDMEVIDAGDGTILPGFIDCHAHLTGNGRTHFDSILTAAHQVGLLLDAGFTYVRDMSLFGGALSRAADRAELRSPGIMPGGRVLSPTAGHSDSDTSLPPEVLRRQDRTGYLADGAEGCLTAVRMQFRDGARFIKICATGGVSSASDGLDDVQYSDEEIAVICAEAARHGTYVAAHCSNAAGALQALQNGVMCIEHGIDLCDDCIKIMAEKNVPLVTTLFVSNLVATHPGFPDYMREKGKRTAESHVSSVLTAKHAGIRIALGTDFSNSQNTPYLGNGMEFQAIVNAGFTPMEAIKAGTINGAHVCKMAHRIGSLEKGKQADIVIANGNPLENIDAIAHADHITFVMRKGKMQKG